MARTAKAAPADIQPSAEALAIQQEIDAAEGRAEGAPGGAPNQPGPTSDELKAMEAKGFATAAMTLLSQVLARRWGDVCELTSAEQAQGVNALVPVLLKYDVASTFFTQYRAEIGAGLFFAGLYAGKRQALEAHRAEEARRKAEKDATDAQAG